MITSYEDITYHQILNIFFQSSHSLKTGDIAGAHTQIFKFDPQQLSANLYNLVKSIEGENKSKKQNIELFSSYFSNKFLFKIGRMSDFSMKLGSTKQPVVAPRSHISEIFGSLGYSIYPSWSKTYRDSLEACREIPYFFTGKSEDIFISDIVNGVKTLLKSNEQFEIQNDKEGFFLFNVETQEKVTFFDLINNDDYSDFSFENISELENFSKNIRKNPISKEIEIELKNFFNAPVTIGVRDVFRWFAGARHPNFNWDEAKNIILDCFKKYGNENFLLPEVNYYVASATISEEKYKELNQHNNKVVRLAVETFIEESNSQILNKKFLLELFQDLFKYHYDYPKYKISRSVGLLNSETIGVSLKLVEYLIYHLNKIRLPKRRNSDFNKYFKSSGWDEILKKFMKPEQLITFKKDLLAFFLKYDLLGGLKYKNSIIKYDKIPTTFHTIQENAFWLPPEVEKIASFTLEELTTSEYSVYLRKYPELSEKLVVFFVLVLRFFLETDFIPDLRPNEAGINIFIMGIWGYLSDNLVITIYKTQNEEEHIKIKFVDNKDHFKRYRREKDLQNPLGLAKYAMKIVEPVVLPAMLRAIGNFTQIIYENRNGLKHKPLNLKGIISYGIMLTKETINQGLTGTITTTEHYLIDMIDDSIVFAKNKIDKIIDFLEDD